MNSIDSMFQRLRDEKRKAFIPFLPAGDPDLDTTEEVAKLLAKEGANVLEIGFPYSDPIADGPVIQASYSRALDRGLRVEEVFQSIRRITESEELKSRNIPVVGMVSCTLIQRNGMDRFLDRAVDAGLSGAIVPDLPLEESKALAEASAKRDFALIQLITPTTPRDRAKELASRSKGFLYCVSVTGITGERDRLPDELQRELTWLGQQTSLPLCVGFGVSRPEHVEQLREFADGVIVGSALVRKLETLEGRPREDVLLELSTFVQSLVSALNA